MTTKRAILLVIFFSCTYLSATVADNRYFPWYGQSFLRTKQKRSYVTTELFFMTADEARGNSSKEVRGIPEIWGDYDQKLASEALIAMGITSPLFAQWQTQKTILWDVQQKIEAQGIALRGEFSLFKNISLGGSVGLMHISSNLSFALPRQVRVVDLGLTQAQEQEIDRQRRAMNELIGLTGTHWSDTGALDTELYLRWGNIWDYKLKSRKVDASVRAGVYIPSGKKRAINNAASLPFGGNDHTGLFVAGELALELKEDWTFGMSLQLSNRLKKIQKRRLPIKQENHLFGGTTGLVQVNPGVTFVWNPYFEFGDLQDGFGLHIGYVLAKHSGDVWTDKRSDTTINLDLNKIHPRSKWHAEYLSLQVSYDAGKITKKDKTVPIITFRWDAPAHVLGAKEFSKTHKLSLGVALNF